MSRTEAIKRGKKKRKFGSSLRRRRKSRREGGTELNIPSPRGKGDFIKGGR